MQSMISVTSVFITINFIWGRKNNKFSQIKTCKSFFENVLDCDLKEGKLDEWNIGKNAPYSDIQSLLEAVDWDYIKFIFNRSWSDACDEFRMSYIEKMIWKL